MTKNVAINQLLRAVFVAAELHIESAYAVSVDDAAAEIAAIVEVGHKYDAVATGLAAYAAGTFTKEDDAGDAAAKAAIANFPHLNGDDRAVLTRLSVQQGWNVMRSGHVFIHFHVHPTGTRLQRALLPSRRAKRLQPSRRAKRLQRRSGETRGSFGLPISKPWPSRRKRCLMRQSSSSRRTAGARSTSTR